MEKKQIRDLAMRPEVEKYLLSWKNMMKQLTEFMTVDSQ